MRPVLLSIANISPLACLGVFALVLAGLGGWLLLLRRHQMLTRDHLYTALGIAGVAVVFLLLVLRLGHFEIKSYGAMLMLGFAGGIYTAIRLGKRRGVPAERVLDLGLFILVGSIVGARLLYVLITKNAGPFLDFGSLLREGLGGLSFHGGLLGGLLAGTIYIRATKLDFWRVCDAVAPAIALGYAVTRIGCFLNGCCYGKFAPNLPWAVTFPHSPDGYISSVHPTQIYASLMGFTMFGILLLLSRGKGLERAGRLLMAFVMLEGVERFVMEIFRQPDPNYHGLLTPAQIASIVLALGALAGWFLLPKRAAVTEQDAAAAKTRPANVK